jgi:hypothetical protein
VPLSDGSGGNRLITVTNVVPATIMSIVTSGADISLRAAMAISTPATL